MVISVFDRVENIVGKRKMLVTSISPFSTMFSNDIFHRAVKSWDCVGRVNCYSITWIYF